MGHKELRFGRIVYILVFYNISFSWLLLLDGFQFIFLLRDSENDLQYCFPVLHSRHIKLKYIDVSLIVNMLTISREHDVRKVSNNKQCNIISKHHLLQ